MMAWRRVAPTHRPLPLLVYRVRTPIYTLQVTVSQEGQVRHCAPLVRPHWLGQDWAMVWAALEQHYGAGLRITGPSPPCPPAPP